MDRRNYRKSLSLYFDCRHHIRHTITTSLKPLYLLGGCVVAVEANEMNDKWR